MSAPGRLVRSRTTAGQAGALNIRPALTTMKGVTFTMAETDPTTSWGLVNGPT